MIKKFLVIFLVIMMAAPAVAQKAAPAKVLGERHQLPNGLVWLFSEQRSLPLVRVNLLIKGGELCDPPDKAGLANLTALLLTQGTKKRSASEIAREVDFLGARLGASGSDDYTSVGLTVLKKGLEPGLDLFQDILDRHTLIAFGVYEALGSIQDFITPVGVFFRVDSSSHFVVLYLKPTAGLLLC